MLSLHTTTSTYPDTEPVVELVDVVAYLQEFEPGVLDLILTEPRLAFAAEIEKARFMCRSLGCAKVVQDGKVFVPKRVWALVFA